MKTAGASAALIALALACTGPAVEPAAKAELEDLTEGVEDSPDSPDDLHAGIDALFEDLDGEDTPGCSVGVVRDGELVHARGYGMADLERGVPITPETIFDLGSTSKQFTAACVLLLEQDGKLSVDDDVRKWLPELPAYGETITIRHLLHHTSGLRDYLTLFVMAGISTEDLTTDDDALEMIARQKGLNFEPGAEHLYSNSNYFLLSVIVERAAGKTLAEFAEERIFEPLGMESTHVHDDHRRLVPGRAIGYSRLDEETFGIDMSDFEQTGDGAVMSTIQDLTKWDANFYEPVVGGQNLIDALRTKGKLDDGTEIDYARALSLGRTGSVDFESHGGAWAGYRAQMLRFPSERTTVICLCNLGELDPSGFAWRIVSQLLGDKLGPRPSRRPRAESGGVEAAAAEPEIPASLGLDGVYESEELGVAYEITNSERGYSVGVRGRGGKLQLTPEGKDAFTLDGAQFAFERNGQGEVTGFSIEAGRVRDIRFVRR